MTLLKNKENGGEWRGGAAMFPATRTTRTKRTRQILPGAGSGVLSVPLYGDETGVGETPPKPGMRHPGVALACKEKG